MGLTLFTAAPVEPITLAEAARQLGLVAEGSPAAYPDATLVAEKIAEARGYLDGKDGILGRALVEQTWDWTIERFPCWDAHNRRAELKVPLPPLRSVTHIKYYDEANALQTLSSSLYMVDASREPARVAPVFGQIWPSTYDRYDAVTMRFVAGYASDGSPPDYRANIPGPIKDALKLLLSDAYENREAQGVGVQITDNPALMRLLAPYIVNSF